MTGPAVRPPVVTLLRLLTVIGYAFLSWRLTVDGPSMSELWILTVVASFAVAFVLAADWINAGGRPDLSAELREEAAT